MQRWTKEDEITLLELSKTHKNKDIAKIMNKSKSSIDSKLYHLKKEQNITLESNDDEVINYIKNNWNDKTITQISKELGLSRIIITKYAKSLNLYKEKDIKWTEDKINKLRYLASTKSVSDLAKRFNTTTTSILTVASKNNITLKDGKVKWTDAEDETLEKLSSIKDLNEIAKILGKSPSSVRLRAKRKNITLKKDNRTWTKSDNTLLHELSKSGYTVLQIARKMDKTDTMIEKYLKENNLEVIKDKERPWTDEDDNLLKELSKEKYLKELIFILNRPTSSIKRRAKKLNIKLLSKKETWTKDDLSLLKKYVDNGKSIKEIADLMNRTESAIEIKINRENLILTDRDKRFWTEEEEEILIDLWGNHTIEYIAKKLRRSVSSIKNKSFLLSLGPSIDSFYEGIIITELSKIVNVSVETIVTKWANLGLDIKTKKTTMTKDYNYVTIEDLLLFLENNQNIWDSRNIETNILGVEPEWLKEKRIRDYELPIDFYKYNKTKKVLNLSYKGEKNE